MKRLTLVLPTPDYKNQVMAYKEEFINAGDVLAGSGGLSTANTFEEWFDAWQDNRSDETVRKGLVPATTFLAVTEDDELVGMIDIRHRLNDFLLQVGGHIGYSIKKSERQKGYATKMLALALEECQQLNLERVLVTCNKCNIGSAKTILNNGGVLENEVQENHEITQRYWIAIK